MYETNFSFDCFPSERNVVMSENESFGVKLVRGLYQQTKARQCANSIATCLLLWSFLNDSLLCVHMCYGKGSGGFVGFDFVFLYVRKTDVLED